MLRIFFLSQLKAGLGGGRDGELKLRMLGKFSHDRREQIDLTYADRVQPDSGPSLRSGGTEPKPFLDPASAVFSPSPAPPNEPRSRRSPSKQIDDVQ